MTLCSSYIASPTLHEYHESDAFVKMLVGPFGSGKSVGVCADMAYYAMSQTPSPEDNVRYSHWGIVRATYQQLKDSTRKTLRNFFHPQWETRFTQGMPCYGLYRFPLSDGTTVQLDITMVALESPEDIYKIRSSNWTACWINEADSVPYEIFSELQGRVGRYPDVHMGGCRWAGILMDFNQPPPGHYLHQMMQNPKDNWAVFRQPPAAFKRENPDGTISYDINEDAENLRNIGVRQPGDTSIEPGLIYYRNQIESDMTQKRFDRIDHQFCMLDILIHDGKAVYPSFNRELHVSKYEIPVQKYRPVICGMDTSGIHPALVILQEYQGKWCLMDEIWGDELGLESFIEQAMIPLLRYKYADCEVQIYCDPADGRDSYRAISPTNHLKDYGFDAKIAYTNKPKQRIMSVESLLNKQVGGLLIDPRCRMTIDGMAGAYHYRKRRIAGTVDQSYNAVPEKNAHSHIADALQYAALFIIKGARSTPEDDPGFSKVAAILQKKHRTLRYIAR